MLPAWIRLTAAAGLVCTASGCASQPLSPAMDQNAAFAAHARDFVDRFLARNPERSIYAGRYDHAGELTIPDEARRADDLTFIAQELAALDEFDPAALDPSQRTDYELIRTELESSRWYQTVFQSDRSNPAEYNVAGPIGLLLNTEYAPLEDRLGAVLARLERVPEYYAAARAAVTNPTPEHTALAIEQSRGTLALLDRELPERLSGSNLPPDQQALFDERMARSRTAVNGWIDWLRSLEPTRSFRIGAELYEQKLAYDIQAGMTARALYDRALVEKDALHARMDTMAVQLWPKYFPDIAMPGDRLERIGRLIDHLSARHVAREDFFQEIRQQIPRLAAFVDEHRLVSQDPDKPLVVRETPPYMRGSGAGASVSAPGPFNPGAETYYNVTPLDRFTPEQAESYLREYNHWMLQILNIHEGIPGHYTQLLHANRSPSLIKSLFGNGAMTEGWALYAERMMLEEGYGNQEPELWLMHGKWNLRVVCNAILDYAVHTMGMSRDETLDLLRREAFQEETEATEKWRRATLTQVQLASYFAGYAAIYDFREERKAALGDRFDLRAFHDEFLSHGSAPVRIIRELMRITPPLPPPAPDRSARSSAD